MNGPVPLRILKEAEVLEPASLPDLQRPVAAPGLRATFEPAEPHDPAAIAARLAERSAGTVRPAEPSLWLARPVELCRVAGVLHAPRFGALVWPDGSAPFAPLGGPLTDPEKLCAAPFLAGGADALAFAPPDGPTPEIIAASVFMPWGGGFNYGHLLTDALTSLLALEEAGLLPLLPPIAPPLKPWQRQLLALLEPEVAVREVRAPVVRLGQAAYATSIDHYLHAPGPLLLRLRERLLRRVEPRSGAPRRLYLSRRSHAHPMRVCLNEVELERALAARGFAIVRPERLSPAEQIALAAGAEVIVGPTGAAMANALFAAPGANVVEIQPQVFSSAWVPAFGERVGHDWRIYYAPAPAPVLDVPWVRRARRGFRFGFRVPLDDFLPFLDGVLAGA